MTQANDETLIMARERFNKPATTVTEHRLVSMPTPDAEVTIGTYFKIIAKVIDEAEARDSTPEKKVIYSALIGDMILSPAGNKGFNIRFADEDEIQTQNDEAAESDTANDDRPLAFGDGDRRSTPSALLTDTKL